MEYSGMKYLSRKKIGIFAPDALVEETYKEYQEYLSSIADDLPASVSVLAQDISFHDGRIIFIDVSQDDSVKVCYLVGDLKLGYENIFVTYRGYTRLDSTEKVMEETVNDRRSEIFASEIIKFEEGIWSHNLLFEPRFEFSITFKDLNLERVQLDFRHIDYFGDPFID